MSVRKSLVTMLMGAVILTAGIFSTVEAYSVQVRNRSDYTIFKIFTSPCSLDRWGSDLLGESGTLAPYRNFTITQVNHGCWDFRVVDEEGDDSCIWRVRVDENKYWNFTNSDYRRSCNR